jgi:two-component system chemotaxis response regulator CheB
MAFKVLIVDDSSFFRRRVTDILNQDRDLEVIGTAVNGKEAVEKAIELKPDVITMDVEMPVMDGITAVRQIMKAVPTPILMFSSLTHQGAKATFDALDAGALDFLPKKFEDIARDKKEAGETLQQRVKAIARKRTFNRPSKPAVKPSAPSTTSSTPRADTRKPISSTSPASSRLSTTDRTRTEPSRSSLGRDVRADSRPDSRIDTRRADTSSNLRRPSTATQREPVSSPPTPPSRRSGPSDIKLLAIGTSTGGPVALQKILTALPQNYPQPILLIQHMPATFTAAFAARLNTLCQITVKEAENGEVLRPGTAYLAPGGQQMMLEGSVSVAKLKVRVDDSPRITYKPSVDITFGSAARVFQDKVLAIVLTGMGADGREGARMLQKQGSRIWAQDEQSCVVYGMPQAVASAGISEANISLNDMADRIIKEAGNG